MQPTPCRPINALVPRPALWLRAFSFETLALAQDSRRFVLRLLLVCYVPVLLIWSGLIPFACRFQVLAAVLLVLVALGLHRGFDRRELGFTLAHSRRAIGWNLLFLAVGAVALCALARSGWTMPRQSDYSLTAFLFYLLFLGPVQEVIFRGILFAEMRKCGIVEGKWLVLISTCTFCFLHIIYNNPSVLLLTLVSGFVWGVIFLRWPSIWGVSLSHSLLGALAMFLGIL
jgi:membrane protease YdiL (CAAX protease family)